MVLNKPLAVTIVALTFGSVGPSMSDQAQHGEQAITCMNKSSGTTWQIRIDFDRVTVDSNPATITNYKIAWRDANDGWRYTLDRKTGDLTVVLASSMGGNMYFHRCQLDR